LYPKSSRRLTQKIAKFNKYPVCEKQASHFVDAGGPLGYDAPISDVDLLGKMKRWSCHIFDGGVLFGKEKVLC
jgi:hypothetical protein